MSPLLAIAVVGQHFLFDWILQPRWVAVNKSHNNQALALHGGIIFVGMLTVSLPAWRSASDAQSWGWAIAIAFAYTVLHVLQDRVIWSWYGKPEDPFSRKGFWNTIAIDQFLHLAVAFLLLGYLS